MRLAIVHLLSLLFITSITRAEQNWPQFRGPRGDGTSLAIGLPLTWSESNNIAWKVAVPGRGRSSPVVDVGRIWLTTALEQGTKRVTIAHDDMQTTEHVTLRVVCLEALTGKMLWQITLFDLEAPPPVHWYNSWATPTAVVEPNRVYCDFGAFGTACLDANGKVLWKKKLPIDHQVGPGASPILWRDLLFLARDGRDAQYITALNKHTGEEVWKTDRPPIETRSKDLKKSFVTPLLVTNAERTQLIAPCAHWVVSYNPQTGAEWWRARHGEGFSIGSCPVFANGLAVFSTGCFKPQLLAIRANGNGDVTATHIEWKTLRGVPVMSSPVVAGSELYWVSDDGMATCADVRTGEIHWQERLGGLHLASPLFAEGRIYFFAQDGKCTVVKASKQFQKLAENQLEGPVVATPAMVDGAILLRSDSHLYRIAR